jgi:hypothetical protein
MNVWSKTTYPRIHSKEFVPTGLEPMGNLLWYKYMGRHAGNLEGMGAKPRLAVGQV